MKLVEDEIAVVGYLHPIGIDCLRNRKDPGEVVGLALVENLDQRRDCAVRVGGKDNALTDLVDRVVLAEEAAAGARRRCPGNEARSNDGQ